MCGGFRGDWAGSNFFIRVGSAIFGLEDFPLKSQIFQFFPLRFKKISPGRVKKYSRQSRIGLLFTAGKTYAQVGSGSLSIKCLWNRMLIPWQAQFRIRISIHNKILKAWRIIANDYNFKMWSVVFFFTKNLWLENYFLCNKEMNTALNMMNINIGKSVVCTDFNNIIVPSFDQSVITIYVFLCSHVVPWKKVI